MPELHFEDANTYSASGGYWAPNEQLDKWDELIKDVQVYRAAGICSGGEVGFFTLLPKARTDVVLIDHSYKSLAIAMLKFLMLSEHGADEAYKLFTTGSNREILEAMKSLSKHLPSTLKRVWDIEARYVSDSNYYSYKVGLIKREWGRVSLDLVKKIHAKLDKVSFVHGDLTDLKGPFGVLYLSNALEHTGRKGRPLVQNVEKAVKPGGHVLSCHDPFGRTDSVTWETLNTTYGDRTERGLGGRLQWDYRLHRVPVH